MMLQRLLLHLCSTTAQNGNTDHSDLLGQLTSLGAKSSTDIGRIYSAPPLKIQIDPSKPLPTFNQCSIKSPSRQNRCYY